VVTGLFGFVAIGNQVRLAASTNEIMLVPHTAGYRITVHLPNRSIMDVRNELSAEVSRILQSPYVPCLKVRLLRGSPAGETRLEYHEATMYSLKMLTAWSDVTETT